MAQYVARNRIKRVGGGGTYVEPQFFLDKKPPHGTFFLVTQDGLQRVVHVPADFKPSRVDRFTQGAAYVPVELRTK